MSLQRLGLRAMLGTMPFLAIGLTRTLTYEQLQADQAPSSLVTPPE